MPHWFMQVIVCNSIWVLGLHSRPENQFHEIFWPNSIFCNFKNGQKSISELGKCLKLPKMQIHKRKILIYLILMSFYAWTFLIFLVCCEFGWAKCKSKKWEDLNIKIRKADSVLKPWNKNSELETLFYTLYFSKSV